MKIYQALANAFINEQVDLCFALLGDANMHWAGALAEAGVGFVYTRHEHAAVAAATSYARVSGKPGVATVTCGPGLTQIMTILPIAVRANIPLIVFAGEAPLSKPWYNQGIDQAPFVEATGAQYRALHNTDHMVAEIHNAFEYARCKQVPVVLGVPFDLQQLAFKEQEADVFSAPACTAEMPQLNAKAIETAAQWITESKRPVLLAGLGATAEKVKAACVNLAQASGACLATTLPAKGLFFDQPYCLGVAGGFATEKAKEIFLQADMVIAVGARLASHTFDGGRLTPNARVIHVDIKPQIHVQGRKASDLTIASDALPAVEALSDKVSTVHTSAGTTVPGWRTDEMRGLTESALILADPGIAEDGFLHPMSVIKHLSEVIPSTCHMVNTSGHSAYYAAQMNYHPQSHYTVIREFGAIGNGTSFAMGISAAFAQRPVVLIDGDGSALMHIQELETMVRHQMHILIIVLNDGAYGSEVHKLRADEVTVAGSVFGRPDFAGIGRGFGLAGVTITDLQALKKSMGEFLSGRGPAIWDIHISDQIASPQILRAHQAT